MVDVDPVTAPTPDDAAAQRAPIFRARVVAVDTALTADDAAPAAPDAEHGGERDPDPAT